MRAYNPGGRFDSDFESDSISAGISADLTSPAGTVADWWIYDSSTSVMHEVYDVEPLGAGRVWKGPTTLSVIRASISEGSGALNERGFYNADTLHLTVNIDDLYAVNADLFYSVGNLKPSIDNVNRNRVVWHGQVYRPVKTQPAGLLANRYTLVVIDLIQVMPDELVNDAQFIAYAQL